MRVCARARARACVRAHMERKREKRKRDLQAANGCTLQLHFLEMILDDSVNSVCFLLPFSPLHRKKKAKCFLTACLATVIMPMVLNRL